MPVLQTRRMPVAAPTDEIADRLARAGCVAPREEAGELLAAAPDAVTLEAWMQRREGGEPLAWIIGRVEFCGRPVSATSGVYVPRPHTEDLARRAVHRLPADGRALDLCTGIGAIAAHLSREVPSARVVGVDIDANAAACARANGVPTLVGDLGAPIGGDGTWDLVTVVAPYVPTPDLRLLPADVQRYEPKVALDGGLDGLDIVRRVVDASVRLLRPGGWLLMELGGTQDEVLVPTIDRPAYDAVERWFDEDGDLRGLGLRRDTGRFDRPWSQGHDDRA
jgi:release factor glutamine methyltransferase